MPDRDMSAPEFTRGELNRALIGCVALCASLGAMIFLGIMANYQLSMERTAFYDAIFSASVWPLALPGLLATGVAVVTIRDVWLHRERFAERIILSLLVGLLHVVAATFYWSWTLWSILRCRRSAGNSPDR